MTQSSCCISFGSSGSNSPPITGASIFIVSFLAICSRTRWCSWDGTGGVSPVVGIGIGVVWAWALGGEMVFGMLCSIAWVCSLLNLVGIGMLGNGMGLAGCCSVLRMCF